MNIALERLFEGIVTTLRADVIPHVGDSFARGQAVGISISAAEKRIGFSIGKIIQRFLLDAHQPQI